MIADILLWAFLIGMLILGIGMFIFATFGLTFIFGAPWIPSRMANVKVMLELADVKEGETVTDLGSGDGRLLIMAVKKFGAKKGIGHEIHPGLIIYAKMWAKFAGVSRSLEFKQGNYRSMPLEKTDVVVLYLLEGQMRKLAPKLKKELTPDTRIVSNGFLFPGIKPLKTIDDGEVLVHLYRAGDL